VSTESMFSPPRNDAQQRDGGGLSAWPALAAASFAWLISLVRLLVGQGRHESFDLDLALAVGAMLLIPSIILLSWLTARRARRAPLARGTASDRRTRLSLVPSAPRSRLRVEVSVGRWQERPAVLAASMHKENMRRGA
jgi:hypothetical protein